MSLFDIPNIERGQLWVHGGGVAEFKSSFLYNWALHILMDRRGIVYFTSHEHSQNFVEKRLIHLHATAKFDGDLFEARADFVRQGRFHYFGQGNPVDSLREADLVILDTPAQAPTPRTGRTNPYQFSQRFALDHMVPVLVTTQLPSSARNQARSNGRYELYDFPERAIRCADRITSSTLLDVENGRKLALHCLKDRSGVFQISDPEVDWSTLLLNPPVLHQGPLKSRFHIIDSL